MDELQFSWICPHCGLKNRGVAKISGRSGWIDRSVELCDVDEGGCDKYVVVKPTISIAVETWKLVAANSASIDDPVGPSPLDNY